MTARRRATNSGGFTLLELLIALSIVGVLLAIAFGGLRMAVVAWARGEERSELQQHARGLAQILTRTVGAAYPYVGAFGEGPEKRLLFNGAERRIEFVSQATPFPSAVQVAFTAVIIGIEDEGQGRSLVIRQRILPNREPFSKAEVVLRDPAIQGLEVKYLVSEGNWTDSWDADTEKKLPAAIRLRFAILKGDRLEPSPPITVSLRTLEPQPQ